MAHVYADLVRETTATNGTGTLLLGGPMTGYRSFTSVAAVGDTFEYTIRHDAVGTYEFGVGTLLSGNRIQRTTVRGGSSGTSHVDFGTGTKEIWIAVQSAEMNGLHPLASMPADPAARADRAVYFDADGDVVLSEEVGVALGQISANAASAAADAARAEDAATAAELAEAGSNASGIYEDTAAGIAATADGQFFYIPSASEDGALDLYRNDSEVATYLKTTPSAIGVVGIIGDTIRDYEILASGTDLTGVTAMDLDEDGYERQRYSSVELPEPTLDLDPIVFSPEVQATFPYNANLKALYELGITPANFPPTPGVNDTLSTAVELITDAAGLAAAMNTYAAPLVNMGIEQIEWADASGRVWSHFYGNNGPLGTTSEESEHPIRQTALLRYTDDFKNGAQPATDNETDDVIWHYVAALRGAEGLESVYVADSMLIYVEGKLVWLNSIRYPSGRNLTIYAWVIDNPDTCGAPDLDALTEADEPIVIGPATWAGLDFPFRYEKLGSDYRLFTCTQLSATVDYRRLKLFGDRATSELISHVPDLPEEFEMDYPEPTAIHRGGSEITMNMRHASGQATWDSLDDGKTWVNPRMSYFETNPASTSSKAELSRAPNGRPVYAWNANSNRRQMAVAWGPKNTAGDDEWYPYYVIDDRTQGSGTRGPSTTYPRIVYPKLDDGTWDGRVMIAYDRGRGTSFYADGSATAATFTGRIDDGVTPGATGTILTVSDVTSGDGNIVVGQKVGLSPSGTIVTGTVITEQLTGDPGGAGTYQVSASQSIAESDTFSTAVSALTPGAITYNEICIVTFNLEEFHEGDFSSFARYTTHPHPEPYAP